jgi:membrane protein implicated in regulation of membrane protease activity
MESVFLGCFLFGAVFTLVSAVLGIGEHGLDVGHAHIGAHGLAHSHAGHPGPDHPWLILNVSTLVAFLTWFGAVGYLLLHAAGWSLLLALPLSLVGGTAAAMLVGIVIAKIRAGDRPLDPADFRLEGTIAKVSVSIPEQGVGEVIFTLADRRRSEAARGESGQAIPRETEVAILRYDNGVATVAPWSQLITAAAPAE